MPRLAIPAYQPDLSDLDQGFTSSLANVLPRGDGWGPVASPEMLFQALPAACRGIFYARRTNGAVAVFAGTETKLYLLDNTTFAWDDVSQGAGTYAALAADAQWQFAQFGNFVIAVHGGEDPQVYDLSSSSAFADLSGTPPNAGGVAVVGRFLVLYDLTDNPYRVQWSGLNDVTNWTSGTGLSDYQDFPDGGPVRRVVGGEFGFVLHDLAIRRMVWVPGAEVVFEFSRISEDRGILANYSAVTASDRTFFLSSQGFVELGADGSLRPIGKERVDRTLLAEIDDAALHLVLAAADPDSSRVYWSYRTQATTTSTYDHLIAYDYVLDRWSPPIEIEGEYLTSLAQPGLTLEALDLIAPGYTEISNAADNGSGLIRLTVGSTSGFSTGDYKTIASVGGTTEANGTWAITVINGTTIDLQGSTFANAYTSGGYVAGEIDDLEISLDDLSLATLPAISITNTGHETGFLTGSALEATLETSEQSMDGWRMTINGFTPITDAETVYGSVEKRDRLYGAATAGTESTMNDDGFVPLLDEARYARAKVRIPAGTTWTFCRGVEPAAARGSRY